jgi:hypothetical protein
MQLNYLCYLLIINIILCSLLSIPTLATDDSWWNSDWKFREKIEIPFDTSIGAAKYQPIDIRINFQNKCWAKNEDEHSIRVLVQDENNKKKLESQIYDLDYYDDNHINACSIVFLIPEEANGKERYYIYYDDSEKSSPNYVDYVSIEESYYIYEPIPGYPFESHFFKIIEDENIIYAISQKGQFMGYQTSHYVTKLIENSKEVLPKNGDVVASFDFRYYYDQNYDDFSSTSQNLVSKDILIDGNLMVKVIIISKSNKDDLQTTATYTYYHCPTKHKRIHAHVKHESLKELTVANNVNTDGVFARLQCGGIKSNAIKDLNFGEILPYLHIYNENNQISDYLLDPDPEFIPEEYDIRVISNKDDVDLGDQAWASFDEGGSGQSHSIILGSNKNLVSGRDEQDGIQINAYEMDFPHLPGLESDIASFEFGRNSLEANGIQDLSIPEDFIIEFDAELFSSETGGYTIISDEANIFQSLAKVKPQNDDISFKNKEKPEDYTLTVFVHNTFSFPMGAVLSAATGKNFGYIITELYQYNDLIGSGTPERVSLKQIPNLINKTLFQQIITSAASIDWKNISFFKKFTFNNLYPGKYLIRVYRENPFFGNTRKYIGLKTVSIDEDKKIHIFCTKEGSIHISVFDQNDEGVENAEIVLFTDELEIVKSTTDSQGQAHIKAPINPYDSYDLQIYYNNFIIFEDHISLRTIRKILPIKKSVIIDRFDLNLEIVDTWGLPPGIDLFPVLEYESIDTLFLLYAEKISDGYYLFTNLIPAEYILRFNYGSFSIEKNINIPDIEKINLTFEGELTTKIKTLDARGIPIQDAHLIISRGNKEIKKQSSLSKVLVPPGQYDVQVYFNGNLIGSRKFSIFSNRNLDLITSKEPFYPLLVTIIGILFILAGLIISYWKKNGLYVIKSLIVSLLIIAIFYPWWILQGSNLQLETSSIMYLIPTTLVTTTSTQEIIAGELSFLPEIIELTMYLIPIGTIISCCLLGLSIVLKKLNKKQYLLILTISLGVLIGLLGGFLVSMSEITKIGVGSIIGSGNIEIGLPGFEELSILFCHWGPSYGFYLFLFSIALLLTIIIFTIKKRINRD